MAQHSDIVGGSSASRVVNCPGSVALVQKMPPKPSSEHADRGTLLHDAMALMLEDKIDSPIGMKYKDQEITEELAAEKLGVAYKLLDELDPDKQMEFVVETKVDFGDFLPGVFGSADLLGRIGKRAIVLDWKFGDGVIVEAEENMQGMFYAAAAMRTPSAQWVFDGADEIEIVIIQPPMIKRWVTTPARIKQFEVDLAAAVKKSRFADAPIVPGKHCRWCAAKPICPQLTGEVDRAVKASLEDINAAQLSDYLEKADLLEQWIGDLRKLAHEMLEQDIKVPGFKLVAKRATRQWVDDAQAESALRQVLSEDDVYTKKLVSPAQAEKLLKKAKQELPAELVVSVSSGSTLAPESDPSPAVVNIGKQLVGALSKLQ